MQELVQDTTKKEAPDLREGMTVRVHQKIKEGEKERIQIFEGLIIRLNAGKVKADKTFTVRKIVGGVGVEKIFPLYSSNVAKVEIKKKAKVRRSKLYYMRDLSGKGARLKEEHVHEQEEEIEKAVEELAEQKAKESAERSEAPKAAESAERSEAPKATKSDSASAKTDDGTEKKPEPAPVAKDTAENGAEKEE